MIGRYYYLGTTFLGALCGVNYALHKFPREEWPGRATIEFAGGMVTGPWLLPLSVICRKWQYYPVQQK